MKLDTLVFDIETQNFFTDPDVGWDNYAALKISVVGVYSYIEDRYYCYEENEMDKLADLFRDARRIVGFSMNRYDIPVLNQYFQRLKNGPRLWEMERVDLLEEIEMATGARISLDRLAGANLNGAGKTHHGSEAGALYRDGKIEELKEYCLNDVKLTKELYDLYHKQNFLMVPSRKTGEVEKVEFANLAITPSLS